MHRLSTVPLTELFELDFTHHQLLILGGPVVYALALVALQFYESVLRHIDSHSTSCDMRHTIPYKAFWRNLWQDGRPRTEAKEQIGARIVLIYVPRDTYRIAQSAHIGLREAKCTHEILLRLSTRLFERLLV